MKKKGTCDLEGHQDCRLWLKLLGGKKLYASYLNTELPRP